MDKRVYDFLDDVRKSSESKIKQLEEEDPFGNQLSIRRYKNYRDSAIVLQRMKEPVKEPVSFIKAVESGKKIKVEHDFIDGDIDYLEENYVSLDEMFWELGENLSGDGVQDVIMNGKFYIED